MVVLGPDLAGWLWACHTVVSVCGLPFSFLARLLEVGFPVFFSFYPFSMSLLVVSDVCLVFVSVSVSVALSVV